MDAANADPIEWVHEIRWETTVALRLGHRRDRLVADWPGRARLTCDENGTHVRFRSAAGVSKREVEKLRAGWARALVHDVRGQLGLHGAAVELRGVGVLILGPSGAGKSTGAAELCLEHDARLLADDVTILSRRRDELWVLPSERRHFLTPWSCGALGLRAPMREPKRAIPTRKAARHPCRVGLVVSLRCDEQASATSVTILRGSAAAQPLLSSIIRFSVGRSNTRLHELDGLAAIRRTAPIIEIVRPDASRSWLAPFVLQALEETRL